jgi:hypothetical protein
MNVDKLVTMVARLGTSEASPSVTRKAELLDYVNISYARLFQEIKQSGRHLLSATEIVAVTNGVGTLAANHAFILSVRDTGNGSRHLTPTDVEAVELEDPEDNNTGSPDRYYLTGLKTLNLWPRNTTTAKVRSVPMPTDLISGGDESTILIPPPYHAAIVWGAILWAVFDERDKGFNVEASLARQEYAREKGALVGFLERQSSRSLKVKQWQ